jgi:two-component system, cell cycle sensor histidine kinase and response regulator CckA
MEVIFILGSSILVQFLAAVLALRLIPVTGGRRAWILISLGLVLMALRRCITLYQNFHGQMPVAHDLAAEWVTLITSLLMLGGIGWIAPLFHSIKRSETALKASEEKYRLLIETMNDGLIVVNSDGLIAYSNNRFCEILGRSVDEVIDRATEDFISEQSRAILDDQRARRREGGREPYEITWITKAGRKVSTIVSPVPVHDVEGRFDGSFAVVTDITKRKEAEEALQGRERYFRSLIENASDLITILKPDGTLSYKSPAVERVLGFKPEELAGKRAFDFIHPDDLPAAARAMEEISRAPDTALTVELRFQHRDGSWRSLEATGKNLLDDPVVQGIVVNSRDVTERNRAGETLRESEARYRTLFENSKDAIYITDAQTCFTDLNQAASELFGYTREEMLGMDLKRLFTHPSQLHAFQTEIEQSEAVKDFAVNLRKKDDSEIHCLLTSTVRRSPDGGILEHQGIIRDITELKGLEEQFRQSQRLEAIGRLAGGVAHDFNNILTAIMGYGEFLLTQLGPEDRLRRFAVEIQKAAVRAADLTRQLLAFSRRQVLQPKILDLNEVITNLDKMLRRLIGEDFIMITSLCPELAVVKADPGQIEQVIMNLVINARDAMPQGGTLTIETQNVHLNRAYTSRHKSIKSGAYVMLAVSDTGTGMDEETQAHIFEPFFTTKEIGKGTGLGLSTVYGIIKQSEGNIWVYSELGHGTTFKIYLPQAQGKPERVKVNDQPTLPQRGEGTILVVEDEDAVRQMIRDVLQEIGYTVLDAHHADEALAICNVHSGPIDLVLTDLIMPDMSGRELAELLKTLRPEARVLYMSGYTDHGIVHQGVLKEGIAFLQKPFDPFTLRLKVRETLAAK